MNITGRLLKGTALVLSVLLLLTGCAAKNDELQAATTDTPEPETVAPTVIATETITNGPTLIPTGSPEPVSALTDIQRNSINMLNWLTYLSQEINAKSNNRLYIEDVYTLIVNEMYPNAIDEKTQERLQGIRQALSRYRMVDVKRDRILYLYEQSKAEAIRSAVPNPRTVIAAMKSPNLVQLATSLTSIAINSISSYQSATAQTDLQYLQDGWELDDAAQEVFDTIRSDSFDYMVEKVNEVNLPGNMALNPAAIDEFVSWKNNGSVVRRIQFLESHKETYKAFGNYWLVLAQSYFEHKDYELCLEAVATYEDLGIHIFRHDIEYARILPLAAAAAQNVYSGNQLIQYLQHTADGIIKNIGTNDWDLRYFAAQTYLSLYTLTGDSAYLNRAYDEAVSNVNYLVDQQIVMNNEYLAAVEKEPVPAGTPKERAEEINQYNTLRQRNRNTELPPVYEPLLMNCELLFALADQLGISEKEQTRINDILHDDGAPLFLVDGLDAQYCFGDINTPLTEDEVEFNGKEIKIPASWISECYVICVHVNGSNTTDFTDWIVNGVTRKTEGDLGTFTVTLTSKAASSFAYTIGDEVTLYIYPYRGYSDDPYVIRYHVVSRERILFSGIGFERVS